jgi:hypothetical protein
MSTVWNGRKIAKEIYAEEKIPYDPKGETYSYLDHYLIACPDCGAELTIKLLEKLSNPDHTIVAITRSKHKK